MNKWCLYLSALLVLSACGWTPLYNSQTMAQENLNTVWIDTIPKEEGVRFRNSLMDLFYITGEPKQPLYVLKATLSTRSRSLGIQKDDTATRGQLYLKTSYTLFDRETLQPLHRGSAHTIASYNILDNQYSTTISRDDAYKNGLANLAEKLRLNLAMYFDNLQRN